MEVQHRCSLCKCTGTPWNKLHRSRETCEIIRLVNTPSTNYGESALWHPSASFTGSDAALAATLVSPSSFARRKYDRWCLIYSHNFCVIDKVPPLLRINATNWHACFYTYTRTPRAKIIQFNHWKGDFVSRRLAHSYRLTCVKFLNVFICTFIYV